MQAFQSRHPLASSARRGSGRLHGGVGGIAVGAMGILAGRQEAGVRRRPVGSGPSALRVVQVLHSVDRGGAETVTLDLCQEIPAADVEQTILTIGDREGSAGAPVPGRWSAGHPMSVRPVAGIRATAVAAPACATAGTSSFPTWGFAVGSYSLLPRPPACRCGSRGCRVTGTNGRRRRTGSCCDCHFGCSCMRSRPTCWA